MAKLTLQEQMLKAGLVDKKKLKKTAKKSKKSRDMIRETRENILSWISRSTIFPTALLFAGPQCGR